MDDNKKIVAENITKLRTSLNMTQAQLGEELNYSDKSVSKWERGESLPDLIVLKTMADTFGVPIEYFFEQGHEAEESRRERTARFIMGNRIAVSMLLLCFIWLVASVVYVYTAIYQGMNLWQCFVWAVPVSALALYFFYRKYFGGRFNIYFGSVFVWTLLGALYVQFMSYNIWIIFFLGVPVQVAMILLEVIKRRLRQKGEPARADK